MKNTSLLLTILLGLFFISIRNSYSETTPDITSDISIISVKIEYQKTQYPIQYINDNPRCNMGNDGNIYCNDAYLCIDLKNNSERVSWASIGLKITYTDSNGFKFSDAIVSTPKDEYVSLGEEKKYRILLDESQYPYGQTGSFKYSVIVTPTENKTTNDWRSLKVGMTQDEVRQILGEPPHIDDPASDNPIWVYTTKSWGSDGRVYFGTHFWDRSKKVVTKWEEPS